MLGLKHPYVSVAYNSGQSFGGSQRLSGNKTISHCGCGVIAAADLLIYLNMYHGDCQIESLDDMGALPIPEKIYCDWVMKLKSSYFPIIPHFGMNGLGLMAGMQLFFKRHRLPYSCHWCIRDEGIWEKIEKMLCLDIPVIMAVGPNFPFVWKNGRAMLYTKNDQGEYKAASAVKAHFISITAMDDEWLEISSWGRRYYLNRRMYEEYVSMYSAPLVSNILYIKKK